MITKINYLDTFLVRHPVLRAGKNIESCLFDGDNLQSTTHIGYFLEHQLVGVASLFLKNCDLLITKEVSNIQFQIRGMAVLENHQKKGIGKLLIAACEEFALENCGKIIWFNARISAVGFYESLGYKKFGNSFFIENIGEHYLMIKRFVDEKR